MLDKWNRRESKKGTGFVQPLKAHEHWHVDITYLNLGGTFYYLCCVLDGLAGTVEEAKALTERYVKHYNEARLHSAIGYITPKDKLEGRAEEIWRNRDEQLENARTYRAAERRRGYAREIVDSLVEKWSVSSSN